MIAKKIILLISIVAISLSAPYLVFAKGHASGIPFWPNASGQPPLLSCTGDPVLRDAQGNITGPNPNACTSFCDLVDTSINIIYFVMTLALFAIAPILFAWGGIMILTAGANPAGIQTGKKILTGTLIGVVIVLLAFVIIKTLITILGVSLPGFTPGATGPCPL